MIIVCLFLLSREGYNGGGEGENNMTTHGPPPKMSFLPPLLSKSLVLIVHTRITTINLTTINAIHIAAIVTHSFYRYHRSSTPTE